MARAPQSLQRILNQVLFPTQEKLYVGTFSSGLFTSEDGGSTWVVKRAQDGLGNCSSTSSSVLIVHALVAVGKHVYVGTSFGLAVSKDGGVTWTARHMSNGLSGNNIRTIFVTQHKVYVGTTNGLSVSEDDGDTWVTMLQGTYVESVFVPTCKVCGIYIPIVEYRGRSRKHGLSVSQDWGRSWKTIDGDVRMNSGEHTSVTAALLTDSAIYIGFRDGIYASEDGGQTWTSRLKSSFKSEDRVMSIFESDGQIYVGRGSGLLTSVDFGRTWKEILTYKELIGNTTTGYNHITKVSVINDSIIVVSWKAILSSSDRGVTWKRQEFFFGATDTFGSGVAVVEDTIYYAHIEVQQKPRPLPYGYIEERCIYLLISRDKGVSWQNASIDPLKKDIGTSSVPIVHVLGRRIIVTLNNINILYLSEDDGQSWSPIGGINSTLIIQYIFNDGERIYVAGYYYNRLKDPVVYVSSPFSSGEWSWTSRKQRDGIGWGASSNVDYGPIFGRRCELECIPGRLYCGRRLLTDRWRVRNDQADTLFRCLEGGGNITEVRSCPRNCTWDADGAYCDPPKGGDTTTPWYLLLIGILLSLFVIALLSILLIAFLRQRRLKKIMQKYRIDGSQLEEVEKIGSGEFGEVWKGLYRRNHGRAIDVALKISKHQLGTGPALASSECFLREAISLDFLRHRNIIVMVGICSNLRDGTTTALVLEYMNGGNVIAYIQAERGRLVSRDILRICTDVSQAGTYLAQRGIVHRDIGARNVLVQKNFRTGKPVVSKITDFGLAKDIKEASGIYRPTGRTATHVRYTAPEGLAIDGKFTSQSDVWSFGVFMWEIYELMCETADACSSQPAPVPYWQFPEANDVVREVIGGYRLQKPRMATKEAYLVMSQCWATKPDLRPTFEQLINTFASLQDPGPQTPQIEGQAKAAVATYHPQSGYTRLEFADQMEIPNAVSEL